MKKVVVFLVIILAGHVRIIRICLLVGVVKLSGFLRAGLSLIGKGDGVSVMRRAKKGEFAMIEVSVKDKKWKKWKDVVDAELPLSKKITNKTKELTAKAYKRMKFF
jgi:hypothetical protein